MTSPLTSHLRRFEDRFRNASAAIFAGVAFTDLQNRFIEVNAVYCEMMGYTERELLSKDILSITAADDQKIFMDLIGQLLAAKIPSFIVEKRYLKKGTGLVWSRDNVTLLRDAHGAPKRLIILSENIGPRKQMEREHQTLSSIVENSSDFVCVASIDTQSLFLNRAGQHLVGLQSLEEVHATSILDYFPQKDHDYLLKSVFPTILSHGVWSGEIQLRHFKNEQVIPVHASFFLIPRIKQGLPNTIGCIARDITAQKRSEAAILQWNKQLEQRVTERTEELMRSKEALAQAEKLEALGRLSGGIAHDFNNLMTGILGITKDLQTEIAPDSPQQGDLEEIHKAAEKAAALTHQLLAFGRRQVVVQKVLNLNHIIDELKRFFARISEEDVEVKVALDPALGNIKMDQSQLEQIIINLMLNARDAMPQGGQITIQTANVDLDENYTKRHFDVQPGPYICLSVSDTGTGMSAEVQEKVFEPFFTTKSQGKGTGLGLATVYGIIKQSQGDISIYSEVGKGTTFRVYFHRVMDAEDVGESLAKNPDSRGSETILVVEDEDIVRRVVTRALTKRGYRVLGAQNAQEALQLIEKSSIDLMVTDVVMPGMNGQELAKAVQLKRPQMPVLFMSGHAADIVRNRGIIDPHLPFIEKSFSADSFCNKVRSVLDAAKNKPT